MDFASGVRRLRGLSLGLLASLAMVSCTSGATPKLTDLIGGPAQSTPEAPPSPSVMVPPDPAPPAGATGGAPAAPRGIAGSQLPGPAGGQAAIVGFKASTVVLFGGEFGNEGQRVATASLNLPLMMKDASSNASRVQIETAYGPRWIARSEIVLGALERRRLQQSYQ